MTLRELFSSLVRYLNGETLCLAISHEMQWLICVTKKGRPMNHKLLSTSASATNKSLLLLVLVSALAISAFATSAPAKVECSSTYIVRSGDTLFKIAKAHKVTLTDLAKANNITNINLIFAGQSLCIPKEGTSNTSSSQPNTSSNFSATHTANQLSLEVKNYPKNSVFFVRVRVRTTGDLSKQWEKIGVLQTDKNGVGNSKLTLPASLKDTSIFSVCLKNIANSNKTCTTSIKGSGSNSSSGNNSPASFTASVKRDSKLTINSKNLPQNSSFFVKVRDVRSTNGNAWVRVGSLSTGNNGSVTASFDLPNKVQKYATLSVCLKNIATDVVLCTTVNTNK